MGSRGRRRWPVLASFLSFFLLPFPRPLPPRQLFVRLPSVLLAEPPPLLLLTPSPMPPPPPLARRLSLLDVLPSLIGVCSGSEAAGGERTAGMGGAAMPRRESVRGCSMRTLLAGKPSTFIMDIKPLTSPLANMRNCQPSNQQSQPHFHLQN